MEIGPFCITDAPSKLACFTISPTGVTKSPLRGARPVCFPLRLSNEVLPRPRVARGARRDG